MARKAKLKVYIGNWRGSHNACVAATSMKEAAPLFKTSIYDMQQFFRNGAPPEVEALALSKPGTVFYQCSASFNEPWSETPLPRTPRRPL